MCMQVLGSVVAKALAGHCCKAALKLHRTAIVWGPDCTGAARVSDVVTD